MFHTDTDSQNYTTQRATLILYTYFSLQTREWVSRGMGKIRADTSTQAQQQIDYLRGLEHLRGLVTKVKSDIDRVKQLYYCCKVNKEARFERHLRDINEKLLYCNAKLRAHDVELTVVDSELRLVSLLNKVRDLPVGDVDARVVKALTAFWQRQQGTIDEIRAVTSAFRTKVLKRLKSSCTSYASRNVTLTVSTTHALTSAFSKYNSGVFGYSRIRNVVKMYVVRTMPLRTQVSTSGNEKKRDRVDEKA